MDKENFFEQFGVKNSDYILKCMKMTPEEFKNEFIDTVMEVKNAFLHNRLFDYQEEVVKSLMVSRGKLIAFDTGTGKTLTAVASAAALHYARGILGIKTKVLVVTPASLVKNMELEFKKIRYDFGKDLRIISSNIFADILRYEKMVKKGIGKRDEEAEEKMIKQEFKNLYRDPVRMSRYDEEEAFNKYYLKRIRELDRQEESYNTLKKRVMKNGTLKCDESTLLIVDEAHEFKTDYKFLFDSESMAAKLKGNVEDVMSRSRMFSEECVLKVWKVLLMTASPFFNKWFDVMYLLAAIKGVKPEELLEKYTSIRESKRLDPEVAKVLQSKDYLGYDKIDFDVDFFKDTTFFRTIDPSDKRYPRRNKPVYISVPLTDNASYEKQRKDIEDEMTKKLKKGKRGGDNMAFMEKIQKKYAVGSYTEKMKVIANIVNTGKYNKIIVYSRLTVPLKDVYNQIKGQTDHDLFMITGDTIAASKRQEYLSVIKAAKKALVFISDAGGVGLDFKEIEAVIIMEPSVNSSREDQVIGRAVRFYSHINLPEEKQRVDIYNLIFTPPKNYKGPGRTADQILSEKVMEKDFASRSAEDSLMKINRKK